MVESGVVTVAGVGAGISERVRRQKAVDSARHSIEMEGGRVSDAVEADAVRYVAGELSSEQMLERLRCRLAESPAAASATGG